MSDRYPVQHYETVPHDNCIDPDHCDCECIGCLLARGAEEAVAKDMRESLLARWEN